VLATMGRISVEEVWNDNLDMKASPSMNLKRSSVTISPSTVVAVTLSLILASAAASAYYFQAEITSLLSAYVPTMMQKVASSPKITPPQYIYTTVAPSMQRNFCPHSFPSSNYYQS